MIKYSSLFFLCLLIAACHPSYTSKRIDAAAQNLEVRDKVSIERWNHHVFSSGAKLALSLEANLETQSFVKRSGLTAPEFLTRSQSVFNQYFSQVVILSNENPKFPLRTGFLVRIKLDDQLEATGMLDLSLTISDINSREVIDKILVSVDPAILNLGGRGHWEMIEAPLNQVAETLTSK